jgi:hypothetical protein
MAERLDALKVTFADGVSAGMNAAAAAAERAAKSLEKLAAAEVSEETVARRVGKSHESLTRLIDGAAAATAKAEAADRRREASLGAIDRALQKNTITEAEAGKQRERVAIIHKQELDRAAEAGKKVEERFSGLDKSTKTLTGSTAAHAMAMRNLGIQSIDVFQQLASGAPIMLTLIQQGGQVGQMAAVTGTSLGAMAKEVGGLAARFAPWVAAAGIVGGLGLAIYSVLQRSSELDSQQRALSVAIRGVGRDAELSTESLQGYVAALKQQGVTAADAVKGASDLARNAGLSGGMIGRIIGLAPDAAAASGQGVPETMRMLAEGAKGSTDAIQKLDDAFNLLNATEAAQVRTMLEHGDKAGALGTVFGKLGDRVQGLNRDALSPADKAFRDLGNSWDGFMDRVAKSAPVMAMINALGATLQGISSWIDGSAPATVDSIDARLAAISGAIPGNNATAARLRREQAEARGRLLQQRSELAQASADAAEAGFGIPPAAVSFPGLGPPSGYAAKEIDRLAASRVSGSDAGRLASLKEDVKKFEAALAGMTRGTEEYAARSGVLNAALAATKKEISDMAARGETARTGMEKAVDTYAAQTRAAEELTQAYQVSREAVQRVLAVREAEQKAISDGLTPGTAKYAAAVAQLTERVLELRKAEGSAKIAEQIRDTEEQTESQRRMMAAYDGTEESIRRVRQEEAARATVIKSNLTPGMDGYAEAVERLSRAYEGSSDAAREFQHAQNSVRALFDVFGTTLDRIGQGLVTIFLDGSQAAVSFASIARAALASVGTELFRQGAINPIINLFSSEPRPTLYAAAGALAGGGGGGASGGGLLSGIGNAFSLGRLSDSLGLTNFGSQLSGAGEWLGLTGSNGLFGGIGNGISSLLGTSLWSTSAGIEAASAAQIAGAIGPGGFLSEAAVAGNMGISSSLGTSVTVGQLLGGFGLGFGAGSFGGGLLQSALGRTGPAPTIGAGLGAGAGAVIGSLIGGPLIGGLIGGLLGGGGGAFFGPGKKNLFSATGLTLDDSGMLGVGRTFAQLADTSQEVAALQQQVQQINALLSSAGARVTNTTSFDEYGQRRINDANTNTWINVGQGGGRSQSLSFGALRFGADDQFINRGLADRSFGSTEELAAALSEFTTFLNNSAPALKQLASGETSYGIGSLAATIKTLRDQFDAAKTTADKLEWAEYDLIDARERAVQIANDNVAREVQQFDRSLLSRRIAAEGIVENNPRKQLDAMLLEFDAATVAQRREWGDQLASLYGDAFRETDRYAEQIAALEATRGAERLAAAKSYLDAIAGAETQRAQAMQQAAGAANGIIQGITSYARGLTFANDNPLTPGQRYSAASSQFQSSIAAAMGGDVMALSNVTSAAETFRLQSRGMYGSGAQYAADFQSIVSALQNISLISPESLTNSVYLAGMRDQTQTLARGLENVQAEIRSLKAALTLAVTNGPPASRAA